MKPPKLEFHVSMETMAEANPEGKPIPFPVKIVGNSEAEESSCVVCVYAGEEQEQFKADNIYTTCFDCGKDITHRPHVPQKPPKLCVPCAFARMEKESCDA